MTCVYIYSTRCHYYSFFYFFFNETATTEIYTYLHTLSLHDALPIWKYIRSTGTSAALAIFQKPVFQRSTRLRVPSGASPYQNLSLPRISAAACSTTPWAALRSTGITPRRLSSQPITGIRNSESLPSTRMSTPSAILAAKPQSPSQFDECGAPISTSRGMSGSSPAMRQPPSFRIVRPSQRVKRLGFTRGAFGGSGRTTSSCVGVICSPGSRLRSIPIAAAASAAALDVTAFALGVEAALLRRPRGLGGDPLLRRMQTRFDEVRQSLARVLAVALLGAEALRAEHQHAVAGDAPIAPGQQAFAHRFRQRRRIGDVEAQLHRRGHLVDVLPARTRRTHEAFDDFLLGDGDRRLGHEGPPPAL